MTLRRRWIVWAAPVVVLVGLALVATFNLATAARDLRRAHDLVGEAADALTDGRLTDATDSLERAQDLVVEANDRLRGSVVLDLARMVPVVRENLTSLEDSVALATKVIHGGVRILDASVPLQSEGGTLEVSLTEGAVPVGSLADVQAEVGGLLDRLRPELGDASGGLLLPQVRDVRREVLDEARRRAHQLDVLDHGLGLLAEIAGADGDRRYLIAVANTAEMRGSGGMILNYGVLEGRDGTVDLTDFGRVDELALPAPVPEALVPPDYLARWSGFEPLRRIRQANLAGDFTVTAPVLEAMYTAATGRPVDGVIQVDPHGLAAILAGVGPVSVPEVGAVSAENVVALTLHDAYFLYPSVEDRADVLGDVAEAAFTRLVEGDFPSLRPLATSIAAAVDGRHLVMHSTSSEVQSDVEAFGADGALPDSEDIDAFALTAQNLSGNKLDWYLDTDLQLTGERRSGEVGRLHARVTLSNTAPAGATTPRYVYGPGVGGLPAGVLRTVVTLYLPEGTTVTELGGDATVEPASRGTEGGRPYVSFLVDVPASSSRALEVSLRLPPRAQGAEAVLLIPTPRVRATTASVDVATDRGAMTGTVRLDRPWKLEPGVSPAPVLPPVHRW